MVNNSFIENRICYRYTLKLPMRQFKGVTMTYVYEHREKVESLHLQTWQVPCPLSLSLLNIPNCQLVLECLSIYICMPTVSEGLDGI